MSNATNDDLIIVKMSFPVATPSTLNRIGLRLGLLTTDIAQCILSNSSVKLEIFHSGEPEPWVPWYTSLNACQTGKVSETYWLEWACGLALAGSSQIVLSLVWNDASVPLPARTADIRFSVQLTTVQTVVALLATFQGV